MYLCHFRLLTITLSLLSLTACERNSYTTWSCNSATGAKVTMVIRKAQMEFKDLKFDYCGSLGNLSYFDQKCPMEIQESSEVFTPSSGALLSKGQNYQCTAL